MYILITARAVSSAGKTVNRSLKSEYSVCCSISRTCPVSTPFEVCLYLFLMDYCIIKEDYQKVKDEELKPLLHIFQPSPMLKIKGLL